ncbi:MAG: polyphenol oxidase family protein [Spirochaetia bacterium]|jgi:YfiH family protein
MSGVREIRLEYEAADLRCEIPVASGMRAGISLAAAGDMAMSKRDTLPWRARFLADLGLEGDRVFGLHQVHSRSVVIVEREEPEELAAREADGMIGDLPEVVLTVTVADCLPIFIVDRASHAFGLVHSGWKGTGIAIEAIKVMAERFGALPGNLAVTIGPGIGPCCYRVPEGRAEAFAGEFGPDAVAWGPDQTPRLDLRRANTGLLLRAGVGEISVVTDCTCCSPALGSFRRQGPLGCTLMLAYLGRGRPATPVARKSVRAATSAGGGQS